jgi:hypothetical protein
MEPFGVEAADGESTEIASFEPLQTQTDKLTWEESASFKTIIDKIDQTIRGDNFKLDDNYEVADISPGLVKIWNKAAGIEWATSFTVDDGTAKLPPTNEWSLLVTGKYPEKEEEESNEESGELETVVEAPADPSLDPYNLQDASILREERFAQRETTNNKGLNMSDKLKSLNLSALSDEDRAAVEEALEESRENARKARESTVEKQVATWGEELGLSAMPGFLKQVRQILLSDDGATAALLLSDDGKHEEKVTATDIVTKLIESMPKTEAGKIELAAQVDLGSGDHERPTNTDDTPFEDRLKEAREALGKGE